MVDIEMSMISFNELLDFVRLGDVGNVIKCIRCSKSHCQQVRGRGNCDWNDIYHCKSGDGLAHIAARFGHVDVLRCIKEELPHYNFEQANFDGKRPIHEAAQSGHLDCLSYLISLNVELDCLKKADWTPLMLSCTKDKIDVIKALVNAGANQDLKNKDGWTSFHIACREGHLDIVNYLLQSNVNAWRTASKNGRTPLHTAALHGHKDVVMLLLREGEYLKDEQDVCGTTPLMDALRANHVHVAQDLITIHYADVFQKDKLGRQALHHAAQAGSHQSVSFLINECSSDPNIEDLVGSTPLKLAVKGNFESVIKILTDAGAKSLNL